MIRFIVVLFVSLLPVLIYIYLYHKSKKEAEAHSRELPSFYSDRLLTAFIQFLLIASTFFLIFIGYSLYQDSAGQYVPAKIVDGKVEQGHVEKK